MLSKSRIAEYVRQIENENRMRYREQRELPKEGKFQCALCGDVEQVFPAKDVVLCPKCRSNLYRNDPGAVRRETVHIFGWESRGQRCMNCGKSVFLGYIVDLMIDTKCTIRIAQNVRRMKNLQLMSTRWW